MAVGAVMSPANPALTAGEISGLVTLSGPSVAFAVKATAGKLPRGEGRTPPCGAGAAAPPRAGAGRPALRGAVAGALLLRVSSPGHVGRAYALRLAGRDFSANPFREAAMAEEQRSSGVRVCVTGGAGFIGSWLVKKLLERGYTVHATLRDTGDEEKAGLLRRLVPAAAERLRLFEADLFDAATFAPAIAGCRFVFLVATPYGLEAASSKYKTTAEAAVAAARVILRQCEESQTVKRVIHTASIASASPLKEGGAGAGYKDFISESCWTPLNVDYPLRSAHFDEYILSKLQSERELLSYNAGERPAFEVVTLPLGLVAGDTVLGRAPETLEHAVSSVSRNGPSFAFLRLLQRLLGSLPLVHVDDACDALVFCADQPSVAGRFLCAAAYPTIHDVAAHFASRFPNLDVLRETEAVARVQPAEDKLGALGFRYRYGMEEILDDSVACAARLGSLGVAKLSVQKE